MNVDPNRALPVTVDLRGLQATAATGQILTAAAMDAHNNFAQPDTVAPAPFSGATVAGGTLSATLPAKSIVVLQLR